MGAQIKINCDECQITQHPEALTICGNCYNKATQEVEKLQEQLDAAIKEINRLKDVKDLGLTQDIRDLACIAEMYFGNITRCPKCHRPETDIYECYFCNDPDLEPGNVELEYTED